MKNWRSSGFLTILIIGFLLVSGCTTSSFTKEAPVTVTPTPQIVYVTVLVTPTSPPLTPSKTTQPTQAAQNKVTIIADIYSVFFGDSVTFSGKCTGSDSVILTLYGPGQYSNGIEMARQSVNSDNSWSYTWHSGTSNPSGKYSMFVYDIQKTTSASVGVELIRDRYVTLTAQKTNSNIRITYQGGPDAAEVIYLHYLVNEDEKTVKMNPQPGDDVVLTGTIGRDHIMVIADFYDGFKQVVLDKTL